jgi:hypothetical protein
VFRDGATQTVNLVIQFMQNVVIERSSTFTQETNLMPSLGEESKMKFSGRYKAAGAEKFSIMKS